MRNNFKIKSMYHAFRPGNFTDEVFKNNLFPLYRAMSSDSTRDEYVMWVKKWKLVYKAISEEIKRVKFDTLRYHEWQRGNKPSYQAETNIANRQREADRLARYASELIEMRHNNKVLAKAAADKEFNGGAS